MKMQEKCIYYNKELGYYYLVLSIGKMIFGRRGEMINPSYLDAYMSQDDGLKFKIGDIIIGKDWIRNFYLDVNLDEFEFVRKLTDEEFDPIQLLIRSRYRFPSIIIDIADTKHLSRIVKTLKREHTKVANAQKKISILEKKLFNIMR